MEKRFEYRGDLAATPLAEILATIDRYRVPGSLTLTWDERVRKIALDDGQVVTAGSNERETSLGMYLLRHGILMKILAPVPLVGVIVMDGFEIFVAFIQAFIFALLTALYLGEALEESH